jgi:SpoVK/Ycf46/Vps4 family AAA+-type ATPase
MRHFEAALQKIKPSVTEVEKAEYDKIIRDFKKSMAYIG